MHQIHPGDLDPDAIAYDIRVQMGEHGRQAVDVRPATEARRCRISRV